jgi:hypothetical protein
MRSLRSLRYRHSLKIFAGVKSEAIEPSRDRRWLGLLLVVFVVGAMVVPEGFEGLKAEFEGEDGDSGVGVEPGGEEEDDRFDDCHPCVFTIEVGFVGLGRFHDWVLIKYTLNLPNL